MFHTLWQTYDILVVSIFRNMVETSELSQNGTLRVNERINYEESEEKSLYCSTGTHHMLNVCKKLSFSLPTCCDIDN